MGAWRKAGAFTAASLAATVALTSFLATPAGAVPVPADRASSAAAACPPGYSHERGFDARTGVGAFGDTSCKLDHVESFADLSRANAAATARNTAPYGTVAAGAYESAVAEANALPSVAGTWKPLGRGPLDSAVNGYDRTNGLGLHKLSGRLEDVAYDP